MQGALTLPKELQAVEFELSSIATMTDAVLRNICAALGTQATPKISTATTYNEKKPGSSGLCLGLATAQSGAAILGRHTNEGMLTIVFFNEPILEIQDRLTQQWKEIPVNGRLPVVYVGESLQKASNGQFHAPVHRFKQSESQIDFVMYDLYEAPVSTVV